MSKFKWRWQKAFMNSDLQPTTKLVLHTLCAHMNDDGKSCYPAQATIAKETSLARETVSRQIAIAESAGWISKRGFKHEKNGSGWKGCSYIASVPGQTVVTQDHHGQTIVTQDHTVCDAGSQRYVTQDHNDVTQDHNDVVTQDHIRHHTKTPVETSKEDTSRDVSCVPTEHGTSARSARLGLPLSQPDDAGGHHPSEPIVSVEGQTPPQQTEAATAAEGTEEKLERLTMPDLDEGRPSEPAGVADHGSTPRNDNMPENDGQSFISAFEKMYGQKLDPVARNYWANA